MTITLFIVDGMRSDAIQPVVMPFFEEIAREGSYTLSSRTVMPSITLPCILSLFLSVPPDRHGVTSNHYAPPARHVPGLIDILQQHDKQVAAFYNWEQLRDVSRPGALAAAFCMNNSELPGYQDGRGDNELTDLACGWLRTHPVDFVFIYLGCSDAAGHTYGWMSDDYLRTVANAGRCIHRISTILPPGSTVIIASDHGGHTRHHGTDIQEDMTIPIFMNGPKIKQGVKINNPTSILDIAPTVINLFNIQKPSEWEGKVLREAIIE